LLEFKKIENIVDNMQFARYDLKGNEYEIF